MILKSFGCSFIYGSDLSDIGVSEVGTRPSWKAWPALLAQKTGFHHNCCARPGSGNLQIAERVLSHCARDNDTFFVIGWTYIDRFDYTGNNNIDPTFGARSWNHWNTLRPIDTDAVATVYYKNIHSEFVDKLNSLITIKSTIETLKQKHMPFIMTYMDPLLFDLTWNCTPAVIDLQNSIKPYMTDFEGMTFLEWSRKNGFAESKNNHPLDAAHEAAAQYMIKIFDRQKTSDPVQLVHV